MNPRRTMAVARKEFRHVLRDPRSLMLALAVPALMLMLFGLALSLDVDRVPALIYDADQSPASRELIARFRGSRYFDVRGFTSSYRDVEREIDRNRILIGVAIPRDYSRRVASGQAVEVQLLIDGSDSNTASIVLNYAESIVRAYALELRASAQNLRGGSAPGAGSAPVEPRLRVWYNSRLESKNYVVPGLIAVILMIVGALLSSLTIAREWEMGTMEQLLSTPLRPAELVLGKMLAFFAVGLVDAAIAILVGLFVFQVPFHGSALLLIATSCLFLFSMLFWGIYLSAAARSQLIAYQLAMLTSFLPSFLLSGFVYAIESMPTTIQIFTYAVPARYFVTILKGIFLKGVGLEVLWAEVLFLFAFAAIVFRLATGKLRQKLA